METPQNKKQRPQRTPTPKMSTRKKSLFERDRQSPIRESDIESVCLGIAPLSPDTESNVIGGCMKKNVQKKMNKSAQNFDLSLKDRNKLNINLNSKTNVSQTRSRKIDFDQDSPRRSPRIRSATKADKSTSPLSTRSHDHDAAKENAPNTPKTFTPSTDELQILFDNALHLKQKKKGRNIFDENSVSSSDEEAYKEKQKKGEQDFAAMNHRTTKKRSNSTEANAESREKIPRIEITPNTSIDEILSKSIPTKSFYSRKNTTTALQSPNTSSPLACHLKSRKYINFKHSKLSSGINKGVHHKIRRNRKQKNLIKTSVEDILKTIRSDKFKFLPSKRIFNEKLKEVHEILKTSDDPIKRARPLNIQTDDSKFHAAFSDSEEEGDCSSDDEPIPFMHELPEVNKEVELAASKRKFFKSGNHSVKNQYKLTDKIRATVTNGKISILPSKKKKRPSRARICDETFYTEQKTIDDIIQKLDAVTDEPFPAVPNSVAGDNRSIVNNEVDSSQLSADVGDFSHFRARIPYNTNDPEIIEQQQLLLDFLIANQICTEDNFKIFISDPDNHKTEAAEIVDSLVLVVPEKDGQMDTIIDHYEDVMTTALDEFQQFRDRLPYNTTDPDIVEQQKTVLEFLIENQICTEENFKIFITEPENYEKEADLILDSLVKETTEGSGYLNEAITCIDPSSDLRMEVEENDLNETLQIENIEPNKNSQPKDSTVEKLFPIFYPGKAKPFVHQSTRKQQNRWNRGLGANQYQIDAGQKEFGAKQCSKCGLVYTVHEPEEEKLHDEYHNSLHILKFKGWIDEDVVMEFPEWGPDGRIIKVTSSAHPKRRERVAEVLKLVDQELGFSSYILPVNYIVFFAVRRQHVVGFCLVQSLEKANRYVCLNGVDCCTEEVYPAKCGISRIWVAPFHRGIRIASKLIRAVQLHTILGEDISTDEIAFSSPTVDGKAFAQAITKRKDFLVYQ